MLTRTEGTADGRTYGMTDGLLLRHRKRQHAGTCSNKVVWMLVHRSLDGIGQNRRRRSFNLLGVLEPAARRNVNREQLHPSREFDLADDDGTLYLEW